MLPAQRSARCTHCGEEPHSAAGSKDPGVPGLGERGGPGRLQAALPSPSLSRDLCAPPQVPPAAVCAAEDGLGMSPRAAQHPGEVQTGIS